MLKPATLLFTAFLFSFTVAAQGQLNKGVLSGNIMDEQKKALEGATIALIGLSDKSSFKSALSDRNGEFSFTNIEDGYYQLSLSFIGLQSLTLDSIHFRPERNDFNLNELVLYPRSADSLETVVLYAEKPLIESKDGNITFNAGESALAAGSNASDLLATVPLVTKDPDGKITVRGKEPKILIDDKPVELNLQQLQDLLESLPGSSIEKIEVMTNPPPEYANEQGGVINIVTKKGKAGVSGRISVSGSSRGQTGVNGSFSYRKQGLAININAGGSYSPYQGSGYSIRQNLYPDSANFFNTSSEYSNKSIRPNIRMNVDYDINKKNLLNFTLQYNQNSYDNTNLTTYKNINRMDELWKLSQRQVQSNGDNYNPNLNFSYRYKPKPGETLKVIASLYYTGNQSDRLFFQEFLNPDSTATGLDSTQQQLNKTSINGKNLRLSYDKMLNNEKTFLSFGSVYNRVNNHVVVDASFKKKPEGTMEKLESLSNDLWFHQTVTNFRASVKQMLGEKFSITAGTSVEKTNIWFELLKEGKDVKNDYWTWLPFANINKYWEDILSITFSYRRSIRRPGINELNPTIDFSDPYNIRFGNEKLNPSTVHNFDFVIGRTKKEYYLNIGAGYNIVQDVFSRVRTLLPEGKTQLTWENISGRKEYEISTWDGVTLSRKIRVNMSASFIYSRYSAFDKTVRNFRDGGSFTSNLNSSFQLTDTWNVYGSFNVNRFGSPQGYARWNSSMNFGTQQKFFNKRFTVSINVIDPFVNQQRKNFTYGTNFNLESYNYSSTRNFRINLAYTIRKQQKKNTDVLKKAAALKN